MNKDTVLNKKCESIQKEVISLAARIAINEIDFPTSELTKEHNLSSTSHFLSVVYQDYYHIVVQYALVFRTILPIVKKYLVTYTDTFLETFLMTLFMTYNDFYGRSDHTGNKNEFNYDDLKKNPNFRNITKTMQLYDSFKESCDAKNISVLEGSLTIRKSGILMSYIIEISRQVPDFVHEMDIETFEAELKFLPYIETLFPDGDPKPAPNETISISGFFDDDLGDNLDDEDDDEED